VTGCGVFANKSRHLSNRCVCVCLHLNARPELLRDLHVTTMIYHDLPCYYQEGSLMHYLSVEIPAGIPMPGQGGHGWLRLRWARVLQGWYEYPQGGTRWHRHSCLPIAGRAPAWKARWQVWSDRMPWLDCRKPWHGQKCRKNRNILIIYIYIVSGMFLSKASTWRYKRSGVKIQWPDSEDHQYSYTVWQGTCFQKVEAAKWCCVNMRDGGHLNSWENV